MMVVVKIGLMLVEQRLHGFQQGKSQKRLYLSSNVHASLAGVWHYILGNTCLMETKCYYVIASIVAVFFSYWYRPAFRVVPKHEGRTFILPTHCPIGRPATFQLKEGSGNIFQSLIDGQGKSLRDQLGLSSIEHIKFLGLSYKKIS